MACSRMRSILFASYGFGIYTSFFFDSMISSS